MKLVILKCILALTVILGHVNFYLNGPNDLMTFLISSAVNIFFLLSGYFLYIKYEKGFLLKHALIDRILRLIPGGMLASLLTLVFVQTTSGVIDPKIFFSFIKNGIYFFGIDYEIKCAFSCYDFGNKLNSSLWTMPFELYFSLTLIVFFSLLSHSIILRLAPTALIIFLYSYLLSDYFIENVLLIKLFRLAFWFSLGICLSSMGHKKITLTNLERIAIIFTIPLLIDNILYLLFILILIYASFNQVIIRNIENKLTPNRPSFDPTYGTYLIGFPMQQFFYWNIGITNIYLLFIVTAISSVAYGCFSNVYFEKFKINKV